MTLTFIKKTEHEEQNFQETSTNLNYFINSCLETSLKQAILKTTSTGYIKEQVIVYNQEEYGFFIKDSNNYFKNKSEIETTISNKFKEKLTYCLDDFNIFKEQGYEINLNNIFTKMLLTEQVIIAEVTLNMSASIRNTQLLQTEYSTRINYPLLDHHRLLEEYVEEQQKSEFFLISYFAEKMHENQIPYTINYAGEETIIIQITLPDNNEEFEEDLKMRFAIK